MGAIISVDTDRVIRIEGVERLGGFSTRPAGPDRGCPPARPATRGDHILGARQPMMTFLNVFRKVEGCSTSATRASGSATSAR
jgi:UDP-N-acetylglucosamine 1-carboxyvinyltransferase